MEKHAHRHDAGEDERRWLTPNLLGIFMKVLVVAAIALAIAATCTTLAKEPTSSSAGAASPASTPSSSR